MPNFSGIWTAAQQMQAKGAGIWPATPGAPTIGTATAGTNKCASVTFTAPACTGAYPAGVTGYLVTSTPGCVTASGASSPLTVTGLTAGTSYTFKAQATNGNGYGPSSAASNSVTATIVTCATYTTAGTYSWVAPAGVTSVAAVVVGGGSNGVNGSSACCGPYGGKGGAGGGLAYKNAQTVTPGSSYTVVVGAGGSSGGCSYFVNSSTVRASGATGYTSPGTFLYGTGGGNGGNGGNCFYYYGAGGGGAAGYSGNGGKGYCYGSAAAAGSGGAGGGGGARNSASYGGGGGGGIGLYGQGSNGTAGCSVSLLGGGGGSGGGNGNPGGYQFAGAGGTYGGGGGGGSNVGGRGLGTGGAVRIVWCKCGARGTPSFPSTNVGA